MNNASPPDPADLNSPLLSWIRRVCQLQQQLKELTEEKSSSKENQIDYTIEEIKREIRRLHNRLLRSIQKSDRMWRSSSRHYGEALQQTWLYFFENLCDVDQKRWPRVQQPFCQCQDAHIIGRLNLFLKGRVKDAQIPPPYVQPRIDADGKIIHPSDSIPARKLQPLQSGPTLAERVRAWAEADELRELQKSITGYPAVTCQVLILRRLLEESSWKELAREFGVPIPTLSSFYQRECSPKLREFGQRLQELCEPEELQAGFSDDDELY